MISNEKLLEIKILAEKVNKYSFRPYLAGMSQERIRTFDFIRSHNLTPYVNVQIAEYISSIDPTTITAIIDELLASRETIGFYAEQASWDDRWIDEERDGDIYDVISRSDVDVEEDEDGPYNTVGGKRARDHLRKFNKQKEGNENE